MSTPPRGCRRRSPARSATSRSTRTRRPTIAGGCRDTCCRSSRSTGSTRSIADCVSRSRPQAAGGGRASRGAWPRARRFVIARGRTAAAARADLDSQADRHAGRDPRRRDQGRADRSQSRSREAHASPRAEAASKLPGDGRARRADRRGGGAGGGRPAVVVSMGGGERGRAIGWLGCGQRVSGRGRSPPISGIAKATVSGPPA